MPVMLRSESAKMPRKQNCQKTKAAKKARSAKKPKLPKMPEVPEMPKESDIARKRQKWLNQRRFLKSQEFQKS